MNDVGRGLSTTICQHEKEEGRICCADDNNNADSRETLLLGAAVPHSPFTNACILVHCMPRHARPLLLLFQTLCPSMFSLPTPQPCPPAHWVSFHFISFPVPCSGSALHSRCGSKRQLHHG